MLFGRVVSDCDDDLRDVVDEDEVLMWSIRYQKLCNSKSKCILPRQVVGDQQRWHEEHSQ